MNTLILYIKYEFHTVSKITKKNCTVNWHLLDSYQILKTLKNQELVNAVT